MSVVHRTSIFFRSAAAMLVSAVAGLAVTPAPAATMDPGAALANLSSPDYLHRDTQIFSQALELDEGQRMILDALYEDYHDQFMDGWQATQDKINNMRDDLQNLSGQGNETEILDRVFGPFEEWRTEKQRLRERFESDVQAILSSHQLERWPRFMQQVTREKTLHLGRLSGEALNLFHLVNDLRMDDRAYVNIEPLLARYAEELHVALTARNAIQERAGDEFISGLRRTGTVPAPKHTDEMIAARVRVRDVNLRHIDILAEQLPAQHVDRFRERANEAAFPRIYRTLQAERLINRALEIEELDEGVRTQIEQIRNSYLAEMNEMNRRLRQATIAFDPKHALNQAQRSDSRHTGQTVERIEDETREQYLARDERAQYYMELVQNALPAEYENLLPSRAARNERLNERKRGGAVAAPAEKRR